MSLVLTVALQMSASAQTNRQSTATGAAVEFTSIDESSEHAFTVEVPKNWETNTGVATYGTQTSPWMTAASPDHESGIFLGDPNRQFFHVPGPGFPNGQQITNQLGRLRVMPCQTGVEFVTNNGTQLLPAGAQNIKLEGVKDEPALAAKLTSSINMPGTTVTAATARYSFDQNGINKVACVTMQVLINAMGSWSEMNGIGYYCRPGDEDTVKSAYTHARKTMKLDPSWITALNNRNAGQASAVLKQQNDFGNSMLRQQAETSNRTLETMHDQGMAKLQATADRSKQQAAADSDWHKNAMVNHYAQMAAKDNNNYHEVLMIQNKHLEWSPALQQNVEVPNY